jgi:hypothetical protein
MKGRQRGDYKITPLGKVTIGHLISQLDLPALEAEAASYGGTRLGQALHTTVPPSLAPPALIEPLQKFLVEHPFDTNVFGMTRFPQLKLEKLILLVEHWKLLAKFRYERFWDDSVSSIEAGKTDPVGRALEVAREVCDQHGLQFHLASDRAMHDDLWTNTTANMWASRYGIGFFEDQVERGLNHNLTIEIGGMLIIGRRCALLKDDSIERMPTDLVGLLYKSVDLPFPDTVASAVHSWIRDDLALGRCPNCPPTEPR